MLPFKTLIGIDRTGQPAIYVQLANGLNITDEHLMITRGAQMAIYMAAALHWHWSYRGDLLLI